MIGGAAQVDVLANDTDANNDPLDLTDFSDGANGVVTRKDDLLEYTPEAGFVGFDTFTYEIGDGPGGTDTAEVRVTVSNVVVEFDSAGIYPWLTKTTSLHPDGYVLSQEFVLDDGTTTSKQFTYGADGALVQQRNTEADGDIITTGFGPDGQRDSYLFKDISDIRDWSTRTRTYDDDADLVSSTYVYDIL